MPENTENAVKHGFVDVKVNINEEDYSQLILIDRLAMSFLEKHNYDFNNVIETIKELESEKGKEEAFKEAIRRLLNGYKIAVFNNDIDVKEMYEEEFFRERLPEFFLDDNAPDGLKNAFYYKHLTIDDLKYHPEWMEWLKGKEEYIKRCCIINREYNNWISNFGHGVYPTEVDEFVSSLYSKELREDRIKGTYIRDEILNGSFREKNPDLFFDDLPVELKKLFLQRNMHMEDFFALPKEQKDLLKDKEITMLMKPYTETAKFCQKIGGNLDAFKIYEKYKGILSTAMIEIQNGAVDLVDLKKDNDIEKIIKQAGLQGIKKGRIYNDNVPVEFIEENKEFFLSKEAPYGLIEYFYYNRMNFSYLKAHPEYMEFLEGKNIEHCFSDGGIKAFFDFCGSQDLARELGVKYGDGIRKLNFKGMEDYYSGFSLEENLKRLIYASIQKRQYNYDDNMPSDFKEEYPDLFLSDTDKEIIKKNFKTEYMEVNEESIKIEDSREKYMEGIVKRFYRQNLSFEDIKNNSYLREILKDKNLRAVMEPKCLYILDLCNDNKEEFFDIAIEYGDILIKPYLINQIEDKEVIAQKGLRAHIDDAIYNGIEKRIIQEYDFLPKRFKDAHPELFIENEELNSIDGITDIQKDFLKLSFYKGKISFYILKKFPQLKEILKNKDINVCMLKDEGEFIERFSQLLGGDRDKAFNLASRKFDLQLDEIIGYDEFGKDNINRVLAYYKTMKFIPNPIVVKNFPIEKIKNFALNSKLWGKLMSMHEYTFEDDYIASMLEAAIVMGVFETREFMKNGQTMIQGAGEEGFDNLKKLLNKTSKYYKNPSNELKENGKVEFVGKGYVKTINDYEEELIFYNIQRAAVDLDLSDELIQGGLSPTDVGMLICRVVRDDETPSDFDKYFISNGEETYSCNIDVKLSQKLNVLFETLGIKDNSVLSEDEFRRLKNCNRDYILKAFNKTENGYKFNMAKLDETYVIGENNEITEKESKENHKLFNYIKFLMMEYGLAAEGAMLAANNDRSNIDLVLDEEKIEKILVAADEISQKAQARYSYEDLWIADDEIKPKIFNPDVLHKVFDGLNKSYNKSFAKFLLDYGEIIGLEPELYTKINALQRTVVKISKDNDLDGKKITPELVIHMMGMPNYENVKGGFDKGIELAQKFYFTQEQFEEAQSIWEEARRREASSIPRIEKKEEEYSYEVLRLDDATGIFVGNITECCQKIGGVGETAMLHSMTEKNGRVFVVKDKDDKVIAQAWLWRNGNTVCFDNVEVPRKIESVQRNQDIIYESLKKAAKEICDKDAEIIDALVEEGKLNKDKAETMKIKKVTVGKKNTNVYAITHNKDYSLEDKENKFPLEKGKVYNNSSLYLGDSRKQVILYESEDYRENNHVETLAIHHDENIEKPVKNLSISEIKAITAMEYEVDPSLGYEISNINNHDDLADFYSIDSEKLQLIRGTDWFILYSENEENIEIHRMLRSPSSGVLKKSVREQKEAVKRIMDKASEKNKSISMEIKSDKIYNAIKTIIKHTKKDYEMTVDENEGYRGHRIEISGVESR